MTNRPPRVVVVHPDDVNLADVKAAAAEVNTTVLASPYCPRGQLLVIKPGEADQWKKREQ